MWCEQVFVRNLAGSHYDLVELMALNAAGRVTMLTPQTHPPDAVDDAMNDLDVGRLRGGGILIPASTEIARLVTGRLGW